jgi:DNA-binding beta-propeller fold protein YncE
VYTNWWGSGEWHNWGTVGDAVIPTGNTVTAIARMPEHIDLFAVGGDGRVYTTWWDGSWHAWGTVGDEVFPAGSTVSAIARKPDHIDLFAVRDNSVFTAWWGSGEWHAWGRIGNSVALAAPAATLTHFAGAVRAGTTALAAIRLPEPAPAGGHPMTFTSSDPARVKVPGALNLPAGTRTAYLQMAVAAGAAGAEATVTAKEGTRTRRATLSVLPHGVRNTPLGTLAQHHSTVSGLTAVGRYVYATHYFSRVDDGHSSPAEGEVVVIDSDTAKEVPGSRVPVGYQPRSIAVNAKTRRAYVSNYGQHSYSVSVLNVANPTNPLPVTEIELGQVPIDVATNPLTNRVYVTNPFQKLIHVIDGSTNTQLNPIRLDSRPYAIILDPVTNTLFVTLYDINAAPSVNAVGIVRILGESQGQTQAEIETVALYENPDAPDPSRPVRPNDLARDPSTGLLYVACLGGGGVAPAVMPLDPMNWQSSRVPTIAPARAVTVAPAAGQVFIGTDAGVQVLDTATATLVSFVASPTPWALSPGGSGRRVYAGGAQNGVVSELPVPDLGQSVHWA